MKKHLLVVCLILIATTLQAQSESKQITGTRKISKKLTPQQVVDSLNKRFPDAKSVEYFKVSPEMAQNGWQVTEEDNLSSGEQVDYYTISFKRDDLKYYGLYDKDGNLLQAKIEESVSALPTPVKNSIDSLQQIYPGYTVVSKTYFKNQNYSKSKEYYEIVAVKGKTKKRLFYTPEGNIIKVKG
jgi:hypothetical protein